MTRPDASEERMVAVTKRYGLSVVLVLSALLVTLLVRPETLVGPVFLLAVILSAWLGGMGPGLVATLTIEYFFLPPKYTLRFNPAELPELLVFFVSAVVVSAWSTIRNRTETSLRRTRDELENRVQERTSELSRSNEQLRAEIAERERVAAELRDFEVARPTSDGGKRYVRWPTNRRREWTGAWTFTARWSRSSRGLIHRGRIARCLRMPSP